MTPDPLLLALAEVAASCYDNWAPQYQNVSKTVHLFHGSVDNVLHFAFEGTVDLREWVIDFDAVETYVTTHPQMGLVHTGLLGTSNDAVNDFIIPTLSALGWPPYYISGHSKGGGEAILATGLMKCMGHPPLACRAYEPPRVGTAALAAWLADIDGAWTRTINASGQDMVTDVPFGTNWDHPWDARRTMLPVPDSYDIPTKHKIPAVLAAIQAMQRS